MKRGIHAGLFTLVLLSACVHAQAQLWNTDFDRAVSEAKKSSRYMLLDFSGSDWCGWCVKLDKEVFSRPEFRQYAGKDLVCVLIDFPKRKKVSKVQREKNDKLAKKYGVRGFPSVIVLSPEGKLVGKTGYRKGGPEKYVQHLKEMIAKHKAAQ